MLRKISSLLLISLILNLNMVVPAVSYATAEETCSCHINSAEHRCHCENHHHNSQGSGGKSQQTEGHLAIKGRTCSTSPHSDGSALPALGIPFLVTDFDNGIPTVQVSNLPDLSENPLYGVTITPSEKPPTV